MTEQYQPRLKKGETVIEYIGRARNWLRENPSELMDQLPTVGSAFELFDLISIDYDVSLLDEVYEEIEDGNANPDKIHAFIDKYKLDWDKPVCLKWD